MSTIKSSAENLTLNADGANNDIKFQSNGSEVASIDQAGLVTATTFAGSGASLTNLPVQKPSISDGGNATALTIDSNEYVTQNNLPFIFWMGNDLNTRTIANNDTFFNTAQASQGAASASGSTTLTGKASNGITYTSGNGRFTVPVAGRYYMAATFYYASATDQAVSVALYTNGNHAVIYNIVQCTEATSVTISGCANLRANDYIDFRNISGGSRPFYMADTHTGGRIFLIG